jgi:hypothetical protein
MKITRALACQVAKELLPVQIFLGFATGHDFGCAEKGNRTTRASEKDEFTNDIPERQTAWAYEAAQKAEILPETREKHTSGAKAPIDSNGFVPGINPRPTSRLSLFAACKSHSVLLASSARLKSCPVTERPRVCRMMSFSAARSARLGSIAALCVPMFLTGCSLFPTTRKLPVPKAPVLTQTIPADVLVARLNQRWSAINSLTAKVEFQSRVSKTSEGTATDYPSVEGHIVMRKPEMLRVVGQMIGIKVFDMASNGKCFTLSIPHDDKVLKGCGPAKHKSKNTWENLRPGFFFDALLVRGLDADDLYSRVSDSETIEDAARKNLFTVPEYVLTISRRKPGSQELTPMRVVTFHRDDLQPSQQDIYDDEGNLETQVFYQGYQDFEGGKFPSTITIKRPQDEIQIVLVVEDVHENQPLTDDQFVVQIPPSSKIQTVE